MPDDQNLIDVTDITQPPATINIHDDHEVDMAKAQVFRAAKCAMEIHKMLKMVNELEGWMQAKITLAADYLEAVASNLEYDLISATMDTNPINMGIMEAAATKKVDPKVVHAMRALSRDFNKAFSKDDIADKKMGEQIDMVANAVSEISDRIAHHKTAFSDPAATRLGKMERAIFDHFEPVLLALIKKEAGKGDLKKAILSSVKKFGAKLVDARKSETKDLPKVDESMDLKKKEITEDENVWPLLRADVAHAAAAAKRVAAPVAGMIKKGVGAVSRAVGQSPPTPNQVTEFLRSKHIPNVDQVASKLIELGVLPHTRKSASDLDYDSVSNRQRWDRLLTKAGVTNRMDRYNIMNDLVKADITAWMPFMESDQSV